MSELLFEIGTEELPAGFQKPALAQLKKNFISQAKELNLSHGIVTTLGTPRRLALLVEDLAASQPDSNEEFMGPSKQAGFDADGNATKAAMGFARSKGADVAALKVVETEKGQYLMLVQERKGVATAELLPDILEGLMQGFSFAKSMRWGNNTASFARPIQWLVALHDGEIIPYSYEGMSASNLSRGHRFMANGDVILKGVASYKETLSGVFVQVDPEERRSAVLTEIEKAVESTLDTKIARVAVDEVLVDTVCNLVEIPFGVCGSFDEKLDTNVFCGRALKMLFSSLQVIKKRNLLTGSKTSLVSSFRQSLAPCSIKPSVLLSSLPFLQNSFCLMLLMMPAVRQGSVKRIYSLTWLVSFHHFREIWEQPMPCRMGKQLK